MQTVAGRKLRCIRRGTIAAERRRLLRYRTGRSGAHIPEAPSGEHVRCDDGESGAIAPPQHLYWMMMPDVVTLTATCLL